MSLAATILSYNHPELTKKCVSSVLRFYSPQDIFLIHNGSRSENIEQLRSLFPEVNHIEITENRGYSGGANFGLHLVFKKYDWCFFITNDCELIQVGKEPMGSALIAPHIYFRKIGKTDSIGGQFFASRGHLRHIKTIEEFQSIPRGQAYVPGTSFLMHKEIFESTLGFNEQFHTYWEDVDLSLRIQNMGYKVGSNSDFQLVHAVGKTCHKDPFYTSYLFHRNRARLSRKVVSWRDSFGIPRLQLEFNLMFDFLSYTSKSIYQKKWDRAQSLVRAYYGD